LENKVINIHVVAEIAEALGEIKNDIVFVGGAEVVATKASIAFDGC